LCMANINCHWQYNAHELVVRASSRVCQILLGKSCVLPTSKNM
jgi:hypothetical protein